VERVTVDFLSEGDSYYRLYYLNGKYWWATSRGLYELNENFQSTGRILAPGERVYCATEDFEGNIWLTIAEKGLRFFPNLNLNWHFLTGTETEDVTLNNNIYDLHPVGQDSILFCNALGKAFLYSDNEFTKVFETGLGPLKRIVEHNGDGLWFLGSHSILYDWKQQKELYEYKRKWTAFLPETSNSPYFTGNRQGFNLYKVGIGFTALFSKNPELISRSGQLGTKTALRKKDGTVWISAGGMLFVREPGEDAILEEFIPEGSPNSQPVNCFAEGPDSTLWIGGGFGVYGIRDRKIIKSFDNHSASTGNSANRL